MRGREPRGEEMIPHVVIRNLAIPLAAGIHYLNIISRRRLEPIYAIGCNTLYTVTNAKKCLRVKS